MMNQQDLQHILNEIYGKSMTPAGEILATTPKELIKSLSECITELHVLSGFDRDNVPYTHDAIYHLMMFRDFLVKTCLIID